MEDTLKYSKIQNLICINSITNRIMTDTVMSAYLAHLRNGVEFKNVDWTKLKFYLYQDEEWFILNKKKSIFIKYLLRIY